MSSGFISEADLEEKRKLRQLEWEKVRKPEDPETAPEEVYDGRSLFDRLKEQKDLKQAEWDEAHKLKNMVRGLDDDEADFLQFVDKTKLAEESRIQKEESDELEDYRQAVAKEREEKMKAELKGISSVPLMTSSSRSWCTDGLKSAANQKSQIATSIIRKRAPEAPCQVVESKKMKNEGAAMEPVPELKYAAIETRSDLRCIAKLPGIGCYDDTTDDSSSGSEDAVEGRLDLCGRIMDKN